jgi:hypothetical protein
VAQWYSEYPAGQGRGFNTQYNIIIVMKNNSEKKKNYTIKEAIRKVISQLLSLLRCDLCQVTANSSFAKH